MSRYQIEMRLRQIVRCELAPASSQGSAVAIYRDEARAMATALRRGGVNCDPVLVADGARLLAATEVFVREHLHAVEVQQRNFGIAMELGAETEDDDAAE